LPHAEEWILFEDNLGPWISIDETALSQGELYTVVTNKEAKGQKGTIVAIIKGTQSEKVRAVLEKIPLRKRNKVNEVTLDMAANMETIARHSFPNAKLVTDRFHVQKLAYDALQEMRIAVRCRPGLFSVQWDSIRFHPDRQYMRLAHHCSARL